MGGSISLSAGRTISVKLRMADFKTFTRARTLAEPTDLARVIYATACELYEGSGLERVQLRLVGVRVENLAPVGQTSRQLALNSKGEMHLVRSLVVRVEVKECSISETAIEESDGEAC